MKHLLLLFFSFTTFLAFAEDEILLKNGTKASIKPNTFRVDYNERKISYQIDGSSKEVTILFQDFDWVTVGINKFQTFKFEGSSVIEGYFVLSETSTKKLIFRSYQEEDSSVVKYSFYIVDNNNKVLDFHAFDNGTNKKSVTQRSEIFLKIRYYFSECSEMLQRLEVYDQYSSDLNHNRILLFFKSPIYYNCK
jgi:hypothetical protein